MEIVMRSNNPVALSYATALLRDAGIEFLLLDEHMSVVEGSIGILPRRLLVAEDDKAQAERVLGAAGVLNEL